MIRVTLCRHSRESLHRVTRLAVRQRLTSDWRLGRYNNLELNTYQNDAVSGKSDFHVDIRERREADEFSCKDMLLEIRG